MRDRRSFAFRWSSAGVEPTHELCGKPNASTELTIELVPTGVHKTPTIVLTKVPGLLRAIPMGDVRAYADKPPSVDTVSALCLTMVTARTGCGRFNGTGWTEGL